MVSVALLVGFVVAPVAAALVYLDANGRNLSRRRRLLWVVGIGAVSFSGFLVPFLFADALHRLYLQEVKPSPVVDSPVEILMVHLVIGFAISIAPLLPYRIGVTQGSG